MEPSASWAEENASSSPSNKIDRISGVQLENGNRTYLVHWKTPETSSWIPEESLIHAKDAVKTFITSLMTTFIVDNIDLKHKKKRKKKKKDEKSQQFEDNHSNGGSSIASIENACHENHTNHISHATKKEIVTVHDEEDEPLSEFAITTVPFDNNPNPQEQINKAIMEQITSIHLPNLHDSNNGLLNTSSNYYADNSYINEEPSGTVEDLVPIGEDFNGLTIKNANDFDIIDQNVIIFTESSHRWSVSQFGYMFVEHIFNGRVLKYDIAKNKLELILDGLYFPNGFLLHPDGESFLVGEFGASRITRFYLSGPKKGKKEFFAENLPGYSDNIRLSSHGTIYVAMAAVRDPDQQSYMEKSASYPQVRKVLLQVVPEIFLKLWTLLQIGVTRGLVLEYDYNGTLLRSLQDPTGGVNHFSHVEDDGTHLYLGSYINDFIAKVSIKKIEEELNVKF
uniref:Strictosidine synthase conserved region domain-containing protein n=1 Tax=Acrobeloides nanus TaxID=290746 RepID=A0A914E0D7_9BILA